MFHPEMHATLHLQRERELARQDALVRAARACSGCIVRARRGLARLVAALREDPAAAPAQVPRACCPA